MAKINGGIIGPNNPTGPFSAGGVWRLEDAFNAQKAGEWPVVLGYQIPNSLRFNSGSSDYLERTPASASNRDTFTISFWIKRSKLGDEEFIFYAKDAGDNDTRIYFETDNTLKLSSQISNVNNTRLNTTQVFRDISAWYHIVYAIDTTQATDTNRAKLYVNGVQVTVFATATYPSQNTDTFVNDDVLHTIGRRSDGATNYFNGYISEFYVIDGQQLTPSSFGQTDATTGIWQPIAYTGSFGTNGFYLKFQDSSALGDDTSGNGNDFTVNNLTSIDQSYDSPTNNFATLNAVDNSSVTLSQGNLSASCASPSGCRSTIGVTTGKWYIEIKYQNTTSMCGVVAMEQAVTTQAIGATIFGQSGGSPPELFLNGSGTSDYNNATAFTANDIMQIALDMDSNTVYFGLNGSWFDGTSWNSASPNTGHSLTSGYTYGFRASTGSGTSVNIWNFGYPPFTISSGNADANGFGNFEYAVPSGYYALCSKNLALYG